VEFIFSQVEADQRHGGVTSSHGIQKNWNCIMMGKDSCLCRYQKPMLVLYSMMFLAMFCIHGACQRNLKKLHRRNKLKICVYCLFSWGYITQIFMLSQKELFFRTNTLTNFFMKCISLVWMNIEVTNNIMLFPSLKWPTLLCFSFWVSPTELTVMCGSGAIIHKRLVKTDLPCNLRLFVLFYFYFYL